MRVLVTGATGNTGRFVVLRLVEQGYSVRCLVRRTSDVSRLPSKGIELCTGDLADEHSLTRAVGGVDALVCIAPIQMATLQEPSILDVCGKSGCRRAVFVGTLSVFTRTRAPSLARRVAAERRIKDSSLDYTILRPNMIYGVDGDRNMSRLIRLLHRRRVVFIPGPGSALHQPVHVRDLAWAIVQALSSPVTIGRCYDLPGRDVLSFNQIIDTICAILGRHVIKIHFPYFLAYRVLKACQSVGIRTPVSAHQVERLMEDKNFDYSQASRDFGYSPTGFMEGIRLEIEEMGLAAQSVHLRSDCG